MIWGGSDPKSLNSHAFFKVAVKEESWVASCDVL